MRIERENAALFLMLKIIFPQLLKKFYNKTNTYFKTNPLLFERMLNMNELICPKCQNEEGTTSFKRYDEENGTIERRKCDDEACSAEYVVRYGVKSVELNE